MPDIYEEIVRLRQRGEIAALATITSLKGSAPQKASAKILVRRDGTTLGTVGGGCVEADVIRAALIAMDEEKAQTMSFVLNEDDDIIEGLICGGRMEVYVEPLLPPPRLIIIGAGYVGAAVAQMAHLAEFHVTVVDDRPRYANRERLPEVDAIKVGPLDRVFQELPVTSLTYIVIVTRGHRDDQDALEWAVTTKARYVGMMGSKKKVKTAFANLEANGISPELLARVDAPIGLEIEAVTPEEIAVSIMAQLVNVRRTGHTRE